MPHATAPALRVLHALKVKGFAEPIRAWRVLRDGMIGGVTNRRVIKSRTRPAG